MVDVGTMEDGGAQMAERKQQNQQIAQPAKESIAGGGDRHNARQIRRGRSGAVAMGDSAYLALLHVARLVVLSKNAGCDNVAALAAATPATSSYCNRLRLL